MKVTWIGVVCVIVLLVVAAVLCIKYIPGAYDWVTDLFSPAEQTEQTEDTENTDETETTLILTKGAINYEFIW
mgnify:CR=1 FL=1